MTAAERESAGRCALAALAIVAAVALTSCGGSALDNARSTVATSARVVAAADALAADVIAERIEATESEAELVREERRAARVVRAFTGVHVALLAADSTLDAVATGSLEESTWRDTVACLVPALLGLVDALEGYGLGEQYTEPIRFAVGALSVFLGGSCGGGE
jgi:hypothetical protein